MSCTMTPEQCADLEAKIADLEQQYEDLLSGRKARVLVDQNGERIEFNGGQTTRLWNYILMQKNKYANCCGIGRSKMSRPIKPYF